MPQLDKVGFFYNIFFVFYFYVYTYAFIFGALIDSFFIQKYFKTERVFAIYIKLFYIQNEYNV